MQPSGFFPSSPESGSEEYLEDIAETDSGESDEYRDDFEYECKNFISNGDIIEELVDDEKSKHPDAAMLDSEDEDGFPISSSREKEPKTAVEDRHQAKNLKRKIEEPQSIDATEEGQKKKKKKKNKSSTENKDESGGKKNKEKKGKEQVSVEGEVQNVSAAPNVRKYCKGVIVEEIEMGKPDGKIASFGKRVLVRFKGKLKKTGKKYASSKGKKPFKFAIGAGQAIDGMDVGVEGMRVGGKRRLTIPPSMGYGVKGGGIIPPNAWLEMEVELIDVLKW